MKPSNTVRLLSRARALCKSTQALARRLDRSDEHTRELIAGERPPDAELALRIAAILGLPEIDVLAYFELDQAQDERTRAWWQSRLPRHYCQLTQLHAHAWQSAR